MALVYYKLRQQSLTIIEPTLHTVITNKTTTETIIQPNTDESTKVSEGDDNTK